MCAGATMSPAAVPAVTSGPGLLYRAAARGEGEKVAALLAGGNVDVDERVGGRTPLFAAAINGHEEVCLQLLDAGADIDATESGDREVGSNAWTPVAAATVEGHAEVCRLLAGRGANLEARLGEERQTLLLAAAEEDHEEVVDALLDCGADPEATDLEGQTPLYVAAWLGHMDVVEVLLKRGVSANRPTNDGRTPIFAAAQEGHDDVLLALLAAGADVDYARVQGETALWVAAHKGEVACVEALLDSGADSVNADLAGDTPLALAAKGGHEAVVQLLTRRCSSHLAHIHYSSTCSQEQKGMIFRAADDEVTALRSQLREQAEAMAAMKAAHEEQMKQLMAGFPFALAGAVAELQRDRDAALSDVKNLRAEILSVTRPETGAVKSSA